MQEVVKQISERLSRAGHDVTVATSHLPERVSNEVNGVKIVPFHVSGNLAEGLRGEVEQYRDFVLNSDFDVMLNYAAQQWATDALIPVLDDISSKKVLVPCGFSALYLPSYQEYFRSMRQWLTKYDACVFASTKYRDTEFAREEGVRSIRVIPNGAAQDEFSTDHFSEIRKKLHIGKEVFLILTVGSHTGLKGHAEVIEMFRQARIQHAALLIVGNDVEGGCTRSCKMKSTLFNLSPRLRARKKSAIVRSLSREDVLAAYRAADLFVLASKIECSPIVLYEAMASQTAFLTSDVGNAKEIIEWSNGGLLISTTFNKNGQSVADLGDGAAKIERLERDEELLCELSCNGFRAWQRRFTWEKIAGEYEQLYLDLTGREH